MATDKRFKLLLTESGSVVLSITPIRNTMGIAVPSTQDFYPAATGLLLSILVSLLLERGTFQLLKRERFEL